MFSRSKVAILEHFNNILRGSYERNKKAQSVSGRKGRALTVVCWSPAVLSPTVNWARASEEAAALALLTRLSATQQLRAINPAPNVPPPRDGAPAHSHSLPTGLLALLQTSEYQHACYQREEEEEEEGETIHSERMRIIGHRPTESHRPVPAEGGNTVGGPEGGHGWQRRREVAALISSVMIF